MILITVGPSCSGKSTLIQLLTSHDSRFKFVCSYTTRPMREGESDSHPYHFIDEQTFNEMAANNEFIEYSSNHGYMYGKKRNDFDTYAQSVSVVDIDSKGLPLYFSEFGRSNCFVVFVTADEETLRQRMVSRDGEVNEVRMKNGEVEKRYYVSHGSDFDYYIDTTSLTSEEVLSGLINRINDI